MSDLINFAADRLVHVYGDSESADFIQGLRRLAGIWPVPLFPEPTCVACWHDLHEGEGCEDMSEGLCVCPKSVSEEQRGQIMVIPSE